MAAISNENQSNLTTAVLVGLIGFGIFGNMRILPAAFDLALASLVVSSIKRVGNFEIIMDRVQPHLLRWILLQMIFFGDGMLDVFIFTCKRYPHLFRVRSEDETNSDDYEEVPPKSFFSYAMNVIPESFMAARPSIPAIPTAAPASHSPTRITPAKLSPVRQRMGSDIPK